MHGQLPTSTGKEPEVKLPMKAFRDLNYFFMIFLFLGLGLGLDCIRGRAIQVEESACEDLDARKMFQCLVNNHKLELRVVRLPQEVPASYHLGGK